MDHTAAIGGPAGAAEGPSKEANTVAGAAGERRHHTDCLSDVYHES
jgi:hypothetical protein